MNHPRLCFGCANLGISWNSKDELSTLAGALASAGVKHLDTAARYPPHSPGLAERLMGEYSFSDHGFYIDTKIMVKAWDGAGSMSETAISQSLSESLAALNTKKLYTLYCHGPDRQTPISEQAAAIDRHYKNNEFEYFGVSNLDANMLAEWLQIAEEKGYVKPSIYQGQYNLLCRGWEDTIFPLLRQHKIKFSAFSPLAGGFLTGKLTFADPVPDSLKGTRFEDADGNLLGKAFRRWYDKPSMHSAIKQLKESCERENISLMEASLRWIAYHSGLNEADEIVFGATSPEQIQLTASAISKGELPKPLVQDIENIWNVCKDDGLGIIQY